MLPRHCGKVLFFCQLIWCHTFFQVCFSKWVSSHEHSRFTGHQGKEEAIALTPLYRFHLLHRHLHISQVITPEISLCTKPVAGLVALVSEKTFFKYIQDITINGIIVSCHHHLIAFDAIYM